MSLCRWIVVVLCLLIPARAYAQPNCKSVIIPALSADQWGIPQTGILHQIAWAEPPGSSEPFGRIVYPIFYNYPETATAVGLMTLMARTATFQGFELLSWGFQGLDPHQVYVLGRSGALYPWRRDAIRFVWYHTTDTRAPAGIEPTWAYNITLEQGDSVGIHENLSVILQRYEAVSLGVVMRARAYPEPIRVEVALHVRECR